jgi:lipopolysaccharide heptosyltransferase I
MESIRMVAGMDAVSLNDTLSKLEVRRICVIKPSALGDVVQSLPVLPILRHRFPDSHIAWVINRELSDVVSGHSCINELIPFDRRGGASDWWNLLGHLKTSRFDLVLDLQGLFRTGVMCLATRAPLRIGLQTAREGSGFACHQLLHDSGSQVPAHRRAWRLAEELGLGDMTPETEIFIPAADQTWATRIRTGLPGPLLVIQPGTRWETKLWPIPKFAEVVRRAMKQLGMSAIVIGSRNERPAAQELVEIVQQVVPRGHILNFAGQTSLKQLAALLKQADLVLSNDSGPLHMAAGLGTPVVGIYTCTSPVRSGPPGAQHQLVSTQLPCAASYCKRCPHAGNGHLACFEELTPDRVWQSFLLAWTNLRRRTKAA